MRPPLNQRQYKNPPIYKKGKELWYRGAYPKNNIDWQSLKEKKKSMYLSILRQKKKNLWDYLKRCRKIWQNSTFIPVSTLSKQKGASSTWWHLLNICQLTSFNDEKQSPCFWSTLHFLSSQPTVQWNKKNQRHLAWKGRSKTVFTYTSHNSLYRKSKEIYKVTRTDKWMQLGCKTQDYYTKIKPYFCICLGLNNWKMKKI